MADDFTAKFRVDISDLKKNITEANRQIKLANATFKAETAGMDAWSKSVDGISAKLKQLRSNLNSQKSVLTSYETQLERQNQAYSENGKKADELRAKLQELANNGVKKSDEEYRKYQKALTDVTREQANNAKAADDLKIKILNQKAAIGQTEASIRKFTAEQDQLEKDTKILNGEFGTQEERLEALKRQYDRVASAQGKDSDEAKALSKQIESLSRNMNSNQNEMQQSERKSSSLNQNFGKLTATVKSLGSKLSGALKTGLKTAATGMATIAGSAVVAGKKIYDSAQQTADYGDTVDKMSQKLGLSKKSYQEWDYVLSQSGVDIKNMSGGMKTLTNQISAAKQGNNDAIDRFKKLGISISDLKSLSREDIFSKVITGMQSMSDSTDRAALANKIFGKSGSELAPLFNSTAESTEALKKKASELGFVMSDEAVSASAGFKDSLDTLQRTFTGTKNNIIGELLPSITQVMTGLTKLTAGTSGASKDIEEGTNSLVQKLASAIPSISTIFTSLVSALANSAPRIVQTIASGISDNAPKLIESLSKIVVSLVTEVDYGKIGKSLAEGFKKIDWKKVFSAGVDALGGLLNGAFSLFGVGGADSQKFTDSIKKLAEPVGKVIDSVKKAADKILPVIVNDLLPAIVGAIGSIAEGLSPIIEALTPILSKIGEVATNVIEKLSPFFATLGEVIGQVIEMLSPILDPILDLISELADILAPALSNIFSIISEIFKFVEPAISSLKPAIESITNVIKSIVSALSGIIEFITGIFSGDWDKAWSGIKETAQGIWDAIVGIFKTAWELIKRPFELAGQFFGQIWSKIQDAFSAVGTWFSDIFSGAWEGIKTAWDGVKKFFQGIWDGITGVFKGIGTWFSDRFKDAVSGITGAFDGVKDFFKKLWEGIKNVVKKPINWILGGINSVIDGLNSLSIKVPDWVPFVGGQTWGLDIPKIPLLAAKGGIVDKPTNLIAGEAGREAIIPLERNTQWIKSLASELLSAMATVTGSSTTTTNTSSRNLSNNSTWNFTQVINAPEAPSRLEIYRQTQNIISLAKATGGN